MKNAIEINGQWYVPQVETTIIIMAPITKSTPLSLRGNAFCFQNSGNCDIVLSNGFTIKPDQNVWFGNYQELNVMAVDVNVKFLPATATGDPVVQKLEIIEVLTKFTGSGFWIDQPAMRVTNTN